MSITIHSGLKTKILEARGEASKDLKAPAEWLRGLETHFKRRDDGGIYFFDRIWIPSVGGVRKLIMDEAHTSRYSIHPGADKMYYALKDLYWWPGESQLIGPEIVQKTTEKIIQIKERLKTTRSRQKSYVDKRRKPFEFKVGDRVLLKVSSWKGVVRFEPIEIIERDVKKLKRRRILLVKVRWNSRQGAEYTWEPEDQSRKKYLHLFTEPVPSLSVAT
nr:putative reverse transcriptase domain-containing protein [Tanacetum cinerariifolium]